MSCLECGKKDERYNALVMEMMAMKRDGFVPRETAGDPVLMPELPVEVRQAIAQVSTVGSGTWNLLTKGAWDAKRNGVPDKTIAADILAGEQEPW